MFVRFAISVLLLVTAVTAHSAPIRAYFAGQIDTINFNDVTDRNSVPFHVGEKISGWVEMNWDEAYPVYENIYEGGISYKVFIGNPSRSVWNHESSWRELYVEEFGVGLPRYFSDNGPLDEGITPNSWIDDAYFRFNDLGGGFTFDHVIHTDGGAYEVYGSFLFTDKFIMVPESSSVFLILIGLLFLSVARLKPRALILPLALT